MSLHIVWRGNTFLVPKLQVDVLVPRKQTKLLLSDIFPNLKIYQNASGIGVSSRTPLGSSQRSHRPPSGTWRALLGGEEKGRIKRGEKREAVEWKESEIDHKKAGQARLRSLKCGCPLPQPSLTGYDIVMCLRDTTWTLHHTRFALMYRFRNCFVSWMSWVCKTFTELQLSTIFRRHGCSASSPCSALLADDLRYLYGDACSWDAV